MTDQLERLEKILGHRFRSKKYLRQASTHASVKDENNPSNERLEFLGDAVLGLVVTEYLFKTFPDLDEGDMTAIKSVVVSRGSLLKTANNLKLKEFLALGKGISKNRKVPSSLISNVVEAFIGAIYMDSGYRASRRFILSWVEPMVEKVLKRRSGKNYKSLLQNYTQQMFGRIPRYRTISEEGPDHKKMFELSAVVMDRTFPPGKGLSKKTASLHAARNALRILRKEYGKLPDSS